MSGTLLAWLALPLHAALVALAAPTLDGLLHRAVGLQPWRDLVRMARKPASRPPQASFVFMAAPPIAAAAAALAALLVPSFALGLPTAGVADLVVVMALLALSRAAPALAAYDMGAAASARSARTAASGLPAMPVLLLGTLAVLLLSGGTNLDAAALRDAPPALRIAAALAGLALLAASAREPPAPAIFSGRHLALVTAAAQLRRVAALSVVATVGFPLGLAAPGAGPEAWLAGAAFWALKLVLLGGAALAIAPHREALPAAALLALLAAVILGVQGRV